MSRAYLIIHCKDFEIMFKIGKVHKKGRIKMLLPKGEAVYKDLKTEYVKLEKLIKDLENEALTGYLRLDTSDFTGILFFDRGKLIGAVTEPESESPVFEIMKLSREPGIINVYTLSPEHLSILASAVSGKKLIDKIPFEIVDFVKLMERLSRERLSGIVYIEDPPEEAVLVVYLFDGDPVDFMYEDIDSTLIGDMALEKIEIMRNSTTSIITVYESSVISIQTDPESMRKSITNLYQKICDIIIDQIGEKEFSKKFRKKCLEYVEEYPFLDPFDPGIYMEKNSSELVIQEDIPIGAATEALNKVINSLLNNLSAKDKRLIRSKIKELISENKEIHEVVKLNLEENIE